MPELAPSAAERAVLTWLLPRQSARSSCPTLRIGRKRSWLLWLLWPTAGVASHPALTESKIFSERYSPTTDVVSFSPAAWPMQISHPYGWSGIWHGEPQKPPEFNASDPAHWRVREFLNTFPFLSDSGPFCCPPASIAGLNSIVLLQHTCKLDDSDEAKNCYLPLDQPWLNPFNQVDSDSNDARYTFVRKAVWARAEKQATWFGPTTQCIWGGV